MAGKESVFPIYLQAQFRDQGAFSQFEKTAARSASLAKSVYEREFGGISDAIDRALLKPRNALGGLDLGLDKIRGAADQAARYSSVLRDVAQAAGRVAQTDPSPAFIRQAREALAAAGAAEQVSKSIASEALALDRLQSELDQTTVGTARLASAQRGFTASAGAQRTAYVQTGQQLQDIIISLGSGQRASTVLAQQLPQLAFALSGVGGAAGRVATILSGPWGIALAAGAFALGPLIDGLFKTEKAADDVRFATNSLGDAQGILGSVLDLTTGKVTSQSTALLALAKAQILVARVQAQTRAADARRGVQDIQYRETQFSGGLGGGFNIRRRPIDARDVISQQVLSGALDASTAVERLENLRRVGRLTDEQFASAAASVANLGVELQNVKVFDEAEKLLAGTGGKSLLKPAKAKKSGGRKGDGGAASLSEFGEDAGKRIANITDQFGEAPTIIARMNKALRDLDDIQSDLERRKPAGLSGLLADLSGARAVVANSISTSFDKIVEKEQQRAFLQSLINTGREREASILEKLVSLGELDVRNQVEKLQAIIRIAEETLATEDATADERAKATAELSKARSEYEKLAPLAARQLAWATKTADEEERSARAAQLRSEQIERLSGVIAGTRSNLEDLFSGGKASEFFGNIRSQFNRLRAETAVETLFGGSLRELDQRIRRNDPLNREINNFTEEAGKARNAITDHADALVAATRTITGAPANDNANLASESNPTGLIRVIAPRDLKAELSSKSISAFTREWARSVTDPLTAELDRLLGVKFFSGLSGVLAGTLEGFARAGKVGAGIGTIRGIVESLGTDKDGKTGAQTAKLLSKLDGALSGAQTGDQTAQLLRSLGVKTSRTGGQIGGAIGQFIPIPGGEIIGSIIGSVVGGLFKKTPRGTVTISNSGTSFSGSSKLRSGLSGTGENIASTIQSIADQLGGDVGSFSTSIRQKGKSFYVGSQKFKDQEEASRAALLQAIQNGAVQGIREGSQRLLSAGKDLDKQLQKAVSFQSVFDRLRQYTDPVGAAMERLNREFNNLRSTFAEAGASAAEYADLEKLYGIERTRAVKEANEAIVGSLRSLYSELTAGNDARSLSERLAFAQAAYDPLRARVAAGDSSAYDDFATAARELLGIQREFSGSQTGYFSLLDEVTRLTKQTLDASDAVANGSERSAPVVSAVQEQTNTLLAALNTANAINARNGDILAAMAANNNSPIYGGGGQRLSLGGHSYY
jgi:hypothetical protein